MYFVMLFLLVFLLLLLYICIFILLSIKRIPYRIATACLFFAILELILLYVFEKKTRTSHQGIQDIRIKKLKRYYSQKNYHAYDITVINDLLQKKMSNIEANRIKFSVIIAALIFPLWDIYINVLSENETFLEVLEIILPRAFIIAFFVVLLLPVYNFAQMTIAECVFTTNNIYIIDNIIFLNSYIIHEWEGMENARRRK